MPTKAPADSAQQKRKSGVIDDITNRLKSADASVLTEYRGLTVTELADAPGRAPSGRDRLQDLQEHAGPPRRQGRRVRPRWPTSSRARSRSRSCAPRATRSTAAKALKEFAKTNPNLVVKGGMLGPARPQRRRPRRPRRGAAPRGAARQAGRRVPGAAGEGGGPVPGLHPQLRLRPEGVHRHEARHGGVAAQASTPAERRGAAPPHPKANPTMRVKTLRRPQRPSRSAEAATETEATTGEAN